MKHYIPCYLWHPILVCRQIESENAFWQLPSGGREPAGDVPSMPLLQLYPRGYPIPLRPHAQGSPQDPLPRISPHRLHASYQQRCRSTTSGQRGNHHRWVLMRIINLLSPPIVISIVMESICHWSCTNGAQNTHQHPFSSNIDKSNVRFMNIHCRLNQKDPQKKGRKKEEVKWRMKMKTTGVVMVLVAMMTTSEASRGKCVCNGKSEIKCVGKPTWSDAIACKGGMSMKHFISILKVNCNDDNDTQVCRLLLLAKKVKQSVVAMKTASTSLGTGELLIIIYVSHIGVTILLNFTIWFFFRRRNNHNTITAQDPSDVRC